MEDLSGLVESLTEQNYNNDDNDDNDDDGSSDDEFTYQFQDDGMTWIDYSAEDQDFLRVAFSRGLTTITLESGYEVTMTETESYQVNPHTNKRRQVRRVRKERQVSSKERFSKLIESSLPKDVKIEKLHSIMSSENLNPKDLETPDSVDPTFVAKSLSELRKQDCTALECIS